jgi:hypothetical protein
MRGGKQEDTAGFRKQALQPLGRQGDPHAELLQHIRRAGFGAQRAVAVLGDRHPAAGDDEGNGGGDVQRARFVAACAADIDRPRRRGDRDHTAAKCAHGADHFRHCFAAHAHRHQQARDLGVGRVAGHDLGESAFGFVLGQRLAPGEAGEKRPDHRGHARFVMASSSWERRGPAAAQAAACAGAFRPRAMARKLARMAWPCSLAMLSGWNCTPKIGRVR